MNFQFASCQWEPHAKSFLQKMYPSKIIDESKIPKLVKLIKADVLRIQDPDYHRPCQIVAGNKYSESVSSEIDEAIEEFKREIHDA